MYLMFHFPCPKLSLQLRLKTGTFNGQTGAMWVHDICVSLTRTRPLFGSAVASPKASSTSKSSIIELSMWKKYMCRLKNVYIV